MNLIIQPNQSILDAVLTRYGSLEAAMAFCRSNGIPLSTIPDPGILYTAPAIKGSATTTRFLNSRNIIIGTVGTESICGIVTGLVVTDVTATTATASFFAGAGATALEWAIAITEPESGTLIDPFVTSLTLEGLTPGTETKFWIRTVCDTNVSMWVAFDFITPTLVLGMQMVLRPVMMHVTKTAGLTSDYVLNYVADPMFYNRYDLLEEWPLPNSIIRTTKESIDAMALLHLEETINLTALSGNMSSKTLEFGPHVAYIDGIVFVWFASDLYFPSSAFPKFVDIEGNNTICSPVNVETGFGDFFYMQGTMDFGIGFVEDDQYKQPITIGHHGDNPFFDIHAIKLMKWMGDHYETLVSPLVGETVIISLPAGRHELLLSVIYRSVDATETLPTSYNGVVLDILAE